MTVLIHKALRNTFTVYKPLKALKSLLQFPLQPINSTGYAVDLKYVKMFPNTNQLK